MRLDLLSATGLAAALALSACSGGESDTTDTDGATEAAADVAMQAPVETEDAMVAGTDYNATGPIPCGTGGSFDATCEAGVKRGWDDEGGHLVEVTKPDGMKRAIFFDAAGKAFGADSAQADGSAGWDFVTSRDDDWTIIEYGPERYRIPDALVLGG